MRFFWRYLMRKIHNASIETEESPRLTGSVVSKVSCDVDSNDEGLNITVRSAVGGRIVSFRHHDSRTDRYTWRTYIIPEDLDFERELGKMITLESMRMQ